MNGYGELGLGATSSYEAVPVRVPGLANVATLRLGGYNSYAIRSDGTLWIWGFALSSGRGILSRHLVDSDATRPALMSDQERGSSRGSVYPQPAAKLNAPRQRLERAIQH